MGRGNIETLLRLRSAGCLLTHTFVRGESGPRRHAAISTSPSTTELLPIPFECCDDREGDFQILTRIDVSPGIYGDMIVICFAAPAMKFE